MLDTKTGLMWAKKDNEKNISHTEAEDYCRAYRGGGHEDWRLPTVDELQELWEIGIRDRSSPIWLSHGWSWASDQLDGFSATVNFFFSCNVVWHKPSTTYANRVLPVREAE